MHHARCILHPASCIMHLARRIFSGILYDASGNTQDALHVLHTSWIWQDVSCILHLARCFHFASCRTHPAACILHLARSSCFLLFWVSRVVSFALDVSSYSFVFNVFCDISSFFRRTRGGRVRSAALGSVCRQASFCFIICARGCEHATYRREGGSNLRHLRRSFCVYAYKRPNGPEGGIEVRFRAAPGQAATPQFYERKMKKLRQKQRIKMRINGRWYC